MKKNNASPINGWVYFDNAATTQVLPSAAQAALKCMIENFANPSSLHKFGLLAESVAKSARKTLASILSCQPNEIIFTPSATVSTNIALLGSLNFKKLSKIGRTKILTTKIEHAATRNCLKQLQQQGFEVLEVEPQGFIYSEQNFENLIDETVCMISLMHVNNENGLILPVERIAKICKLKSKNTLIHLDCVQSFTKLPINLSNIPADFVSISGHKINAPKGVGALFVRQSTNLNPILFGGGQQNGLCPGTENIPAIAGFEVAAKFHNQHMKAHMEHFYFLQNKLIEICSKFKTISFNFEKNFNLPSICNLSVNGVRSQVMLNFLESRGFFVSSGSACSKGKAGFVLTNLGYGSKRQDCSIRISFSFQNSIEEVEELAHTIGEGLRLISN